MSIAYINREGGLIGKKEWATLRATPEYVTVREYDNGVVNVKLEWLGRVADYGQVYEEFHKVFGLVVHNYTSDGGLALDPIERDRTFPTEAAAIAFYEEFLTKWTNSGVNDFGEFEETDNSLTPPPPPDPDTPAIEPDPPELGGVGAW